VATGFPKGNATTLESRALSARDLSNLTVNLNGKRSKAAGACFDPMKIERSSAAHRANSDQHGCLAGHFRVDHSNKPNHLPPRRPAYCWYDNSLISFALPTKPTRQFARRATGTASVSLCWLSASSPESYQR
jgi:hypothetical protein